MKNVFALEKRGMRYDGEKFILRRIDKEHADKQKKQTEEERAFWRSAGLPVWVSVCGLVVFFLGTIFLCGFLEALDTLDFDTVFARAGWCMVVGIAGMAIGGVIIAVTLLRARRAKQSTAYGYLKEQSDKLEKACYEALGVSETAQPLDVISLLYKRKKNNKPYKENALGSSAHSNLNAMAYVENDALHLAFPDCVFCIPLVWILKIECVNRGIAASGWNKGEVPKNKLTGTFLYNGCKVRVNNSGLFSTKPYYRMTARDENYEEYYILIPCYDIGVITSLTGKNIA